MRNLSGRSGNINDTSENRVFSNYTRKLVAYIQAELETLKIPLM